MSSLTEVKPETEAGASTILSLLIANGMVVPNPDEVLQYLAASPDVTSVLPDYWAAACQAARDDSQLSLELYRDPEIEDEHLVIYIRQQNYQDDLMDRIDQARESLAGELKGTLSGWIH
ncbi:MAG: hypothetical protein ACREDR_41195, partial [Blastocatellia bacterium]